MMPLTVVQPWTRRDHLGTVVRHTEAHAAVFAHVEVPVVRRRVARRRVAEADDLAAGGGAGAEPRLDRELLARHPCRRRRRELRGRTTEGDRRVDIARHRPDHVARDRAVDRQVVCRGQVERCTARLAEPPVVERSIGQDGARIWRWVRAGHRDRDPIARCLVAESVERLHPVLHRRAGGETRIGESVGRHRIPTRRPRGGVDEGAVVVAVHPVGEVLVVAVPVAGPGDARRTRLYRDHPWQPVRQEQARDGLVRSDARHREAHQALLGRVVHVAELATHHDVLVVAGDVPRALALARERTGVECGEEVEQGGRRVAFEVEVAVRIARQRAGCRTAEGDASHERPWVGALVCLGHATALVRVTDVVHGVAADVHRVRVAVAVGQPVDRAAIPRSGEHTFEVAGATEPESGTEQIVAVGDERRDAGGVSTVADRGVDRHGQRCAGDGIDHAEAEPRVVPSVERRELTANGDLRSVG